MSTTMHHGHMKLDICKFTSVKMFGARGFAKADDIIRQQKEKKKTVLPCSTPRIEINDCNTYGSLPTRGASYNYPDLRI
jgi:hypothetical protein